jgi:hypothetical protein
MQILPRHADRQQQMLWVKPAIDNDNKDMRYCKIDFKMKIV